MGSKADIKSPVELLLTVSRIVREHGGQEVNEWLSDGLDRAFYGGEDLGKALGLNSAGVGREAEINLFRRHERNGFLRIGFSFVDGGNTHEKVKRFRQKITEFENHFWPRLKDSKEPPESLIHSQLWLCLYKARRFGRLPGSIRQLREIVEEQEQ
ncbi:MAG: hypothetical protein M8357_00560 [Desulfobulbaceae bacterium]|nr:hypothetical protein [Desulfobulbaceae bacterium]